MKGSNEQINRKSKSYHIETIRRIMQQGPTTTGEYIMLRYTACHMTQKALADEIGTVQQQISRWVVKNELPTLDMLWRMHVIIGLDIGVFMTLYGKTVSGQNKNTNNIKEEIVVTKDVHTKEKRKFTFSDFGLTGRKNVLAPADSGHNDVEMSPEQMLEDEAMKIAYSLCMEHECGSVCLYVVNYDDSVNIFGVKKNEEDPEHPLVLKTHTDCSGRLHCVADMQMESGAEHYGIIQEFMPGHYAIVGENEFFGEQVMGMEGRITTNIREEDHGGFVCYWLNDEFYVMVMPCVGSQEDMIEFWLCRKNYGIHSFMFGVLANGMELKEAFHSFEHCFRDLFELALSVEDLLDENEYAECDDNGNFRVEKYQF